MIGTGALFITLSMVIFFDTCHVEAAHSGTGHVIHYFCESRVKQDVKKETHQVKCGDKIKLKFYEMSIEPYFRFADVIVGGKTVDLLKLDPDTTTGNVCSSITFVKAKPLTIGYSMSSWNQEKGTKAYQEHNYKEHPNNNL